MGKKSRRENRQNRVRYGVQAVEKIPFHNLDEKYIDEQCREVVDSMELSAAGLQVYWNTASQRGISEYIISAVRGADALLFNEGVLEQIDAVFREACASVGFNSISVGGVRSSSEDVVVVISAFEMVREQVRKLLAV